MNYSSYNHYSSVVNKNIAIPTDSNANADQLTSSKPNVKPVGVKQMSKLKSLHKS